MTPIIVWITRPEADEVYMGGKRHLGLWVLKPAYDHRSVEYDLFGTIKYRDRGWVSGDAMVQAREILSQDKELLYAVMNEVILSLYPKGMNQEQGDEWANAIDHEAGSFDGVPDRNWRKLYQDDEWEAKCNTCFKRFLLKVDLRSNSVERVIPQVMYTMDQRDAGRDIGNTDQIEAVDVYPWLRDEAGPDHIPF